MSLHRTRLQHARRWVVKIGSALLTDNGQGLDQAAMAALSLCTFTPGTQAGKPVRSETTISYVWRID